MIATQILLYTVVSLLLRVIGFQINGRILTYDSGYCIRKLPPVL